MTRLPAEVVIDDRLQAEGLARALVEAAVRAGAGAADATVGLSASLSASAREGGIEDLSRSQSRGAAIRVVVDGRLGFATSSDAPQGPDEIDELARTAVGLARLSGESPHNVILSGAALSADEARAAGDALALWDDDTAALDPAWATAQALAMERVVRGHNGISGVRDVSASLRRGVFALATSTGFVASTRGTTASLSCSAVVQDGAGGKLQTESWWAASRHVGGLPDPTTVATTAAERALARRGARPIPSATLPVIFDPNMARGFFAGILGALAGSAVARRQSFLGEALGEIIMPAGAGLVDDPLLPGGFASRVFDGEGQASQRRVLIDDEGRLLSFLLDARSAARLGRAPTASAARGATGLPHPSSTNTTLSGGRGDLASIVADTKRGLLVTRLLGRGADPTTGELSRGAAGFLIEDGEIGRPVEGITIAGNVRELLKSIDRIGADVDERSALRVPTIRFAAVAVGGTG
jgi:PmbA protein